MISIGQENSTALLARSLEEDYSSHVYIAEKKWINLGPFVNHKVSIIHNIWSGKMTPKGWP